MSSVGAQIGLAIDALVVSVIVSILDTVNRVIPYLTEKEIACDLILLRGSIFNLMTNAMFIALALEILMALHLLLFAIFALVGFNRVRRPRAVTPVTALSLFGAYITLVIVVFILISSIEGMTTNAMVYTTYGIHCVANIRLATGLGFLIAAIVDLRTPSRTRR